MSKVSIIALISHLFSVRGALTLNPDRKCNYLLCQNFLQCRVSAFIVNMQGANHIIASRTRIRVNHRGDEIRHARGDFPNFWSWVIFLDSGDNAPTATSVLLASRSSEDKAHSL